MQDNPSRFDWLISLGLFGAWILTSAGAILDALYIRSAAKGLLQALSIIQNEGYQKPSRYSAQRYRYETTITIRLIAKFLFQCDASTIMTMLLVQPTKRSLSKRGISQLESVLRLLWDHVVMARNP